MQQPSETTLKGGDASLDVDGKDSYVGSSLGHFSHDFDRCCELFGHSWNRG